MTEQTFILEPGQLESKDPLSQDWREEFPQAFTEAHGILEDHTKDEHLTSEEKLNLQKLKELLDKNEEDGMFVQSFDELKKLLPHVFENMKDTLQTPPHGTIDPYDHTFNALSLLNTRELSAEDSHIARAVMIFHDIGKVIDPQDREHPRFSAEIVAPYLEAMGYSKAQQERISNHIKWHDALGEIARRDGRNILNVEDVDTYFPSIQEFMLHKAVVQADLASIPGLKKYVGEIESTYKLLENRMYAQRQWIEPDTTQSLPFEKIDYEEVESICSSLSIIEEFDEVDIRESQHMRQKRFDSLHSIEKQQLEETIVQAALENNSFLPFGLRLTGRETDRTFVKELEKKYGVNLDTIRIAQEIFNSTYIMWRTSRVLLDGFSSQLEQDSPDSLDTSEIKRHMQELVKSAEFLSAYTLEATHVTNIDLEYKIDSDGYLLKSDTKQDHHYEGDGVYTGILGCYRNWSNNTDWSGSKMYTVKVPLADSLPMMVSFNYPKAMANMLGECLYIRDGEKSLATTHGIREWRQCYYNDEEITQWKIDMISELLKAPVRIVNNSMGEKVVVVDTMAPPIVYASIARALRIRELMPESELSKLALEPMPGGITEEIETDSEGIHTDDIHTYYDVANSVRIIKGITRGKHHPQY